MERSAGRTGSKLAIALLLPLLNMSRRWGGLTLPLESLAGRPPAESIVVAAGYRRIDVGIPPKYVGGSVKWISDLDYDEWGIITLWEKVEQFGYKRDEYRCFAKTDNGLIELVLDLKVWNLVNSVVRPKVVEIWVIVRVDGEDDSAENDIVGDDSEEYESAETENESVDEELENFEGSDCSIEARQVDDQDFLKYTDPEVEYTSDAKLVEEGHNQHVEQRPINSELDLSDAGGIEVEGDIQVNVATAEEGIVQDFVAATVDSDVQIKSDV
nr:transposase, MuDR, MULE transposase domain protein [Ipomoea batatas]